MTHAPEMVAHRECASRPSAASFWQNSKLPLILSKGEDKLVAYVQRPHLFRALLACSKRVAV